MAEVRYELDTTGLATLTIDTAGPINTIGGRFVADLEGAWRRAERDGAPAVMIASGKPRSFLDGANLKELLALPSELDLRALLQRFQGALAAMAESQVPIVGVVEGASALGGGFELLLWACDHVVAAAGARLGLPEVNVGLFPAGGGTHTLRRVVGLERALDIMTNGRVLPAEELVATGLVSVAAPAAARAQAKAWIGEHPVSANRNAGQAADADDTPAARELIAGLRSRLATSPCKPWFGALLDSVEAGLGRSVAEAAAADLDPFVKLMGHPNSRNVIDFFFLSTSLGPRLVKVGAEVQPARRIGVIGAGLMGRGIAQVAADRGVEVVLIDTDEGRLKAATRDLDATLSALVAKGRWDDERRRALLSRITPTLDYGELAGVPLVIEAAFEDVEIKRSILARVHAVDERIVFASNTSTIPMAVIGEGAVHPERVVGMHFFSPVPLMPLLEVIEGTSTARSAVDAAVALGRKMGKTCILVGDGPGFYTSRTFGTYVVLGILLAELGLHPLEVDRIAREAGFPQGPLHVYGTAGGAVVYHAGSFLAASLAHHTVPPTLKSLFEAGYVGAGKPCFYRDAKGSELDESVLPLIVPRPGPTPTPEEACDMLLLGMANEALRCYEEGVLRDIASMELGAVLGIGFPPCWHGPARLVSLRGVRACRERLEALHARFEIELLRPCRELDRLAAFGVDGALV